MSGKEITPNGDDWKKYAKQLEKERKISEEKITNLTMCKENLEMENKKLHGERDDISRQNIELTKNIYNLNEEIKNLQSDNENLSRKNIEFSRKNIVLTKKINTLLSNSDGDCPENTKNLEEECKILENKISELTIRNNALNEVNKNLQNEKNDLIKQNTTLTHRINSQELEQSHRPRIATVCKSVEEGLLALCNIVIMLLFILSPLKEITTATVVLLSALIVADFFMLTVEILLCVYECKKAYLKINRLYENLFVKTAIFEVLYLIAVVILIILVFAIRI